MRELSDWNQKSDPFFNQRDILAFDLDDTLTEHGELHASVIKKLEECGEKNILRILVTGRSAGWADALIKLLPFDAIVAENGAILRYFPNRRSQRKTQEKAVEKFWSQEGYSEKIPHGLKDQHQKAIDLIFKKVPGVAVASDQSYRIYDLAIDFCEEVVPPLGLDAAEKIKDCFESLGATAKVSSIHVNGWWGDFSKIEGLTFVIENIYKKSIEKNLVYAGDSPNDGPLFESKALSVGVANINDFESLKFTRPKYICSKKSSLGAIELIDKVLSR